MGNTAMRPYKFIWIVTRRCQNAQTIFNCQKNFHLEPIKNYRFNKINTINQNKFDEWRQLRFSFTKRSTFWQKKIIGLKKFFIFALPSVRYAITITSIDNKQSDKFQLTNPSPHLMQKPTSSIHNDSPNIKKSWINNIIIFISENLVEPLLIACRFTYLLILFLPLIIGSPIIFFGSRLPENGNERAGTILWYRMLVHQMESAGPTFIKLAQWAASRTDIFPVEMCSQLSKLHSSVGPHPFNDTKRIIEKAFNKPFHEIFSEFDPIPIGIGAIAQVYKAKIHPEILPTEYYKNYQENSRAVTKKQFEEGLPIKLVLKQGGGVFDQTIANTGLDAFLRMLIIYNFVHADLHPGNIIVKFIKPNIFSFLQFYNTKTMNDDELFNTHETEIATKRLLECSHDKELWRNELVKLCNEGYQPQLIFIDAGLATSLNETNRKNFLDLFQAVAEFDGYKAGQLMIERCKTPELVVSGDIFALKMQHLVLSVKSITLQLGKFRIADILKSVLQMVRHHHVKLEGDFVNIIISILVLEGIGRQLDPDLDLLKNALPILRKLGTLEARRGIKEVSGEGAWMLKFWFWLEAREWLDNASWQEFELYQRQYLSWPDM
ncbi:Atypical/ABC1/ABC1-C protein kinase [Gigaspora margarita]|uniref:Atypical/ABC1/ABC1-C protein kinase n=1 Tax=Gigaspora margarita TaxID=4874 RepID=A0A8H4B596_GIGMA|nr:Atypical/ABC1/ABC1-C protein kinase [Gigaspora margarita]